MCGTRGGSELSTLYAGAGVYVLPSAHEGLPITLLEALSFGLPCIASDIPANREVRLGEECYFPVGDIAACRHINILEPNPASEPDSNMTGLTIVLPVMLAGIAERNAAKDRDTVVHPLAVQLVMHVAMPLEKVGGEDRVENLGFLETQDVGLLLADQPLDQRAPRPH